MLSLAKRVVLAWQAVRFKRGGGASLHPDSGLIRVDDGTRHIHVPHVRRAASFREGIEAQLEAVARKYVGETGYLPRAGDVVIDIGAGIGEFALWSAAAGARVVAFEPDPRAFACLERNTAGLGSIQIYPYALWKDRSNLRLHGSLDTSESSLIEDGKQNANNSDVEAWPLDQLPFIGRFAVVDFLKIDGEGVEPEILSAAGRTLRRTRVIAIDVGAIGRRPNLKTRVETALAEAGFRAVPTGREDTILALNAAMVGPINNRVLDRRNS